STERTRSPRSAHPPVLLLLDGEAIDAARYIERDLTGDTHSGSKAISLASCSHDRRDEVRRANGDRSSIRLRTPGLGSDASGHRSLSGLCNPAGDERGRPRLWTAAVVRRCKAGFPNQGSNVDDDHVLARP